MSVILSVNYFAHVWFDMVRVSVSDEGESVCTCACVGLCLCVLVCVFFEFPVKTDSVESILI